MASRHRSASSPKHRTACKRNNVLHNVTYVFVVSLHHVILQHYMLYIYIYIYTHISKWRICRTVCKKNNFISTRAIVNMINMVVTISGLARLFVLFVVVVVVVSLWLSLVSSLLLSLILTFLDVVVPRRTRGDRHRGQIEDSRVPARDLGWNNTICAFMNIVLYVYIYIYIYIYTH